MLRDKEKLEKITTYYLIVIFSLKFLCIKLKGQKYFCVGNYVHIFIQIFV